MKLFLLTLTALITGMLMAACGLKSESGIVFELIGPEQLRGRSLPSLTPLTLPPTKKTTGERADTIKRIFLLSAACFAFM